MSTLRPRVLCAFPSPEVSDVLKYLLEAEGFCVVCVDTVTLAKTAASSCTFDLYLLENWWYTDGSGVELCRDLRQLHPATPVLFFSGMRAPPRCERRCRPEPRITCWRPTRCSRCLTPLQS